LPAVFDQSQPDPVVGDQFAEILIEIVENVLEQQTGVDARRDAV
jgi:hypothetical protein